MGLAVGDKGLPLKHAIRLHGGMDVFILQPAQDLATEDHLGGRLPTGKGDTTTGNSIKMTVPQEQADQFRGRILLTHNLKGSGRTTDRAQTATGTARPVEMHLVVNLQGVFRADLPAFTTTNASLPMQRYFFAGGDKLRVVAPGAM